MINGASELSMMKSDLLDGFEEIKVCTHYIINGKKVDYLPFDITDIEIEPVYKSFKGWNTDTTKLTSFADAPEELKAYVSYLENELEVPIRSEERRVGKGCRSRRSRYDDK